MVNVMVKPGGLTTFSIEDGFIEAILRGYQAGFITDKEYAGILQCDTLSDVKLNLLETDYQNFLQEVQTVSPSLVREKALEKLVSEFNYIRANSSEALAQFLDFIRVDYMIDNVMLLLKATSSNPNVDVKALIRQAHPLGAFETSVYSSIAEFDNSAEGYAELYQTVLIDTPVGKYMSRFLKDMAVNKGADDLHTLLETLPTTTLEGALRKYYLEDFYFYCEELGGETADLMTELIKARADATAISITLNSFGTSLNEPARRVKERKSLYPSIGFLYPEGTDKLAGATDEAQLLDILRPYAHYRKIFEKHQSGETTLDDAFYAREAELNELAFEGQSQYAAFYAFVRLKEQELRNLVWICECILQRQKDRARDHFVPIFSMEAGFRRGDHGSH
mmetsp:Transcript_5363/g.9640  ORF Transcript_5363/g.9640 Transcript_5363/m.9640 type:complete len:393 (-) Transcript_5363:50-1228(-)|eukprot:CAMPEP_0184524440 /NCGR_PEP_ID=MMETSP0198_2-20121128/9516_1 /TAXON_ID=1112570 /ORGANISM="Thraustochytrium sp., Strain LLF1b" /LENGTH=392 /DNA_ID=CAMNT_0026915733 /DNA_START=1202 /DNA_END=2380 /DNA_ORIENTATION=+